MRRLMSTGSEVCEVEHPHPVLPPNLRADLGEGECREFMKRKTINFDLLEEQRRIVANLDNVQARLAPLRQLQSQTQEELSALLPSVLDKAFKGEL